MTTTQLPAHAGPSRPVPDEISATDLPVEGALPPELCGRYFRNGPNPLPGEITPHWFVGAGMLHGVRLRDGRAEWYRNRWVRTKALEGKGMIDMETGTIDRSVGVANTHVVPHAGRIMALVESSFPHIVTPDLETVGPCDFDGRLTTAMTAHPKTDPVTGELHFFGYGFAPPFLTYHRLDAAGQLVTSAEIAVPGPTMVHDFAITDRHAVFLDLPITFQFELLGQGMPYGWDDAYGARIGVMPLDRPGEVRWFDVDPCYVFHVGNAHTDAQGRVVLDAARYAPADAITMWGQGVSESIGPAAAAAATGTAKLYRWTLDPATGALTEAALDDRSIEFPTVDDALVGRYARYRYAVAPTGIVKLDADHGTVDEHVLGTEVAGGEAVFVPSAAPDRAEDDGWLLTITTRRDGSASQLLVLDATDVGGAPVATVTLPRGVPAGFHGSWIDDAELGVMNESDDHARGMGTSMLRGLLIDVGLPIVTYYVLRALGAGEFAALLAATGVAAARVLWGVVAKREINQFAVVMLLVYGIGLVLSLVTGDPRILLLKGSLITGAVGVMFLVTAIIGKRPLTLSAAQSFQPAQAAEMEREFEAEPAARRAYRLTSYVWGIGLLIEAIARIPVVYLLPIDIGYAVSEGMLIVAFVLLGGWTFWYLRRIDRARPVSP